MLDPPRPGDRAPGASAPGRPHTVQDPTTLDAAGIRHALIGALALSAHGVNRATVDLDLFTMDTSCLVPEFWAGLRSGVVVEVRKGDLTDPLAGVVRFQAPGESAIDVVAGDLWKKVRQD